MRNSLSARHQAYLQPAANSLMASCVVMSLASISCSTANESEHKLNEFACPETFEHGISVLERRAREELDASRVFDVVEHAVDGNTRPFGDWRPPLSEVIWYGFEGAYLDESVTVWMASWTDDTLHIAVVHREITPRPKASRNSQASMSPKSVPVVVARRDYRGVERARWCRLKEIFSPPDIPFSVGSPMGSSALWTQAGRGQHGFRVQDIHEESINALLKRIEDRRRERHSMTDPAYEELGYPGIVFSHQWLFGIEYALPSFVVEQYGPSPYYTIDRSE